MIMTAIVFVIGIVIISFAGSSSSACLPSRVWDGVVVSELSPNCSRTVSRIPADVIWVDAVAGAVVVALLSLLLDSATSRAVEGRLSCRSAVPRVVVPVTCMMSGLARSIVAVRARTCVDMPHRRRTGRDRRGTRTVLASRAGPLASSLRSDAGADWVPERPRSQLSCRPDVLYAQVSQILAAPNSPAGRQLPLQQTPSRHRRS